MTRVEVRIWVEGGLEDAISVGAAPSEAVFALN